MNISMNEDAISLELQEKDAARYRWLRQLGLSDAYFYAPERRRGDLYNEALDIAIDLAMDRN